MRHRSAPGRIKHAIWHIINVLAMCRYLVSLVPPLLFPAPNSTRPLLSQSLPNIALHAAALMVPISIAVVCTRLLWVGWRRQITRMQQADWTLFFLALMVTTGNVLLRLSQLELHATSEQAQGASAPAACHWPSHFAFTMVLGVLMDLPVRHSVVQGVITIPFLIALDYQEQCWAHCLAPRCTGGSVCSSDDFGACSSASLRSGCPPLMRYLLTKGLLGVVTCLAAGFVPIIVFMKTRGPLDTAVAQAIQEQGEQEQQEQQQSGDMQRGQGPLALPPAAAAEDGIPFETFGAPGRVVSLLLGPLLRDFDAKVQRWVQVVNVSLVVRLLCLPIAVYYLSRTLVSRFLPQSQAVQRISADEWLMVMAVFFLLGRDSSTLDMMPLISHVQERLKAVVKAAAQARERPPSTNQLIDNMRQQVMGSSSTGVLGSLAGEQLKMLELLGEGSFGKVYKATWQGTIVAVKRMLLPSSVPNASKQERLAIMEAAISSSLSHPNVIQTYGYSVDQVQQQVQQQDCVGDAWKEALNRPQAAAATAATTPATQSAEGSEPGVRPDSNAVAGRQRQEGAEAERVQGGAARPRRGASGAETESLAAEIAESSRGSSASTGVTSLEVRIVLEFADCGTLRQQLDKHLFIHPGTQELNYKAVLETAADIAKGMLHLHSLNVLHSDLKALNVLLMRSGSEAKGIIAKVADFGMSLKMDNTQTHISNAFFGTMTHSAPEVIMEGHQTKSSDVYSFGIILYELYTCSRPYKEVSPALLAYQVSQQQLRPSFPSGAPRGYVELAQRCWSPQAQSRPTFQEVLEVLQELRSMEAGDTEELRVEGSKALGLGSRLASSNGVPPDRALGPRGPDPESRASSTHMQRGSEPDNSRALAPGPATAASEAASSKEGAGAPDQDQDQDQDHNAQHQQHQQQQQSQASAAFGGLVLMDLSDSYALDREL